MNNKPVQSSNKLYDIRVHVNVFLFLPVSLMALSVNDIKRAEYRHRAFSWRLKSVYTLVCWPLRFCCFWSVVFIICVTSNVTESVTAALFDSVRHTRCTPFISLPIARCCCFFFFFSSFQPQQCDEMRTLSVAVYKNDCQPDIQLSISCLHEFILPTVSSCLSFSGFISNITCLSSSLPQLVLISILPSNRSS